MGTNNQNINVNLFYKQIGLNKFRDSINVATAKLNKYRVIHNKLSPAQKGYVTRTKRQIAIMKEKLSVQKQELNSMQAQMLGNKEMQNFSRVQTQAQRKITQGLKKQRVQTQKTQIAQRRQQITAMNGPQVMRMNTKELANFNQTGGRFNGVGARMANRFRMMTHGAKGFRMEMLGVMFFGMSIMRVMSGLIRQSLEWAGVTEVMQSALGILFLPVAMKLLDWVLKFLDWVGSLTEAQKENIGNIVLWVAALGGLLTIIGTIALGFGSVIQLFTKATSGLGTLKLGFTGLFSTGVSSLASLVGGFAPLLGIVAVVVAVIAGMIVAWKENFMGMKKIVANWIKGFKQSFGGLIEVFKGVFDVIRAIFTGDGDLLLKAFKRIVLGLKDMLVGGFKMALNLVLGIIVGALRVVIGIFQAVINGWIAIYDKVSGFFGGKGTDYRISWTEKLKTPSFKDGGVMPYTGLAQLHKGETIIPTGTGNNSNIKDYVPETNITVNAEVSSDYDVRRLADQLKRYWTSDFERASKGRTL